jgi:hypothetical protein
MLALVVQAVAVLGSAGPAVADEGAPCTTASGQPGHIVVDQYGVSTCVPDQSTPGGRTPGTPGDPGEGEATCYDGDRKIPCVTDAGVWFSSKHCYANVAQPQPPPDSAIWAGNDPTKGKMWVCANTPGSEPGQSGWFYVLDGGTPPLIDPGELARGAVEQMDFEYADAQIAPGADWHTFIGIENWLWIPPDQWRVLSLRVSAAGTTVTVNATPERVQWDMGTETIACYDAGRAWVTGMSDDAQTTCGYTYEDIEAPEGDTHEVSARIVYVIDWTCTGACLATSGTLDPIRALAGTATSIEVLQRQTVNIP